MIGKTHNGRNHRMTKKYFLRGSNYGGEMIIGTITPEFVTYWQGRDENELLDHLMALDSGDEAGEEEGFDPDSPDILEDMDYYNSWYDIEDIHHQSTSNGTELMAFPMTVGEHGEPDYPWEGRIDIEPHQLYGRECYTQEEPADGKEDDSVPVLVFYSSEKGDFGGWTVELADDEEFDKDLITVSIVETDHGEMIERLWYNKVELEQEYDWADTRGKGYYASVAWFNKRWEDPHPQENTPEWNEIWEYYDDELKERKENLDKE